MKKLFVIVLAVGGLNASEAATISSGNDNASEFIQEKDYKKIKVTEVSKDAMEKIKSNYGAYTVKEAYRASDGDYKLILSKDGVDLTATFTSAGDLIEILN